MKTHQFSKLLLCSVVLFLISTMPLSLMGQSKEVPEFKQHHIGFLLSDVVFTRVSFDYEYIIDESGIFSLHIPASVALSPTPSIIDYEEEIKFWAGVGFNIYPTGQGKLKYFLGPELRYSMVDYTAYDTQRYEYQDAFGNPMYIYEEKEQPIKDMSNMYFLVNNGLIYTPISRFAVSAVLGLGLQSRLIDKDKLGYEDNFLPAVTFSARLGYKF